jgi:hypothetical protein
MEKDWKRAKSGESKSFIMVWRNKSDGDDVVYVKQGNSIYLVERNNSNGDVKNIGFAHTKSQAIKIANEYMENN